MRAYGVPLDAELSGQLVHGLTAQVAIHQRVDRCRVKPLLRLPSGRNRPRSDRSPPLSNPRGSCGSTPDQGLCYRGQGWNFLSKLPPWSSYSNTRHEKGVIKLSPEDTEALREQAARERRSMHEVAVLAIKSRVSGDRRVAVLDELFDRAAAEDAELLDRLAQ